MLSFLKLPDFGTDPSFEAMPVCAKPCVSQVARGGGRQAIVPSTPGSFSAPDDLRAYAYEGECSPSGSLSSTVSGKD